MPEYTIDTNVFIRFLVRDVESQFKEAEKLLAEIENGRAKGKVPLLVINEIIWVLENYYGLKRAVYIPQLLKLLALKSLKLIEVKKQLVVRVLQLMQEQKFDFTDIYLSQISSEKELISFDKDFKKLFAKKRR